MKIFLPSMVNSFAKVNLVIENVIVVPDQGIFTKRAEPKSG